MDNEIINQKKTNNNTLLMRVIYRLLEIRGIKSPVRFFGLLGYRKMRSISQRPVGSMRISTIRWLAKKLDVPPQFIVNISERSNKGEEEADNETTD